MVLSVCVLKQAGGTLIFPNQRLFWRIPSVIFHLSFRSHGQTQPAVTLFSLALPLIILLRSRVAQLQNRMNLHLCCGYFSNYSRVSLASSRDVGQKLNINAIFSPANCLEFVTCTTCRRIARPACIHSNQNGVTLTRPPAPTPSFNRQAQEYISGAFLQR